LYIGCYNTVKSNKQYINVDEPKSQPFRLAFLFFIDNVKLQVSKKCIPVKRFFVKNVFGNKRTSQSAVQVRKKKRYSSWKKV